MNLVRDLADLQVKNMTSFLGMEDIDTSEHEELKLSALHYAAWYNLDSSVAQLIHYKPALVFELDCYGATPLHYAARYKQRLFADPGQQENEMKEENEKNQEIKETADEKASSSAVATIEHLLNAGAKVNARDDFGTTALFYAVLRGNIHAVKILLQQPEIEKESVDNRKLTVLHIAAKYNRVAIAEVLLDNGVQIMPADETGVTPMHIAAMDGFTEMVSLLIRRSNTTEEKFKIVNAKTVRKETPLDFAIESKHGQVFDVLLPYAIVKRTCRNVHYSPLHLATISGTPDMVKKLLTKEPVLLNYRSSDHSTPLHKAAQNDRPKITRHLLERPKVNIEAIDNEKQTPLLVAAANGSNRVITLLLEKGANVKALTSKEQNVIHLIAKNNKPDTMEIILDHLRTNLSEETMGHMINADDRIGNSPLHIAADLGHMEITKILMEKGANLQDKNEDEETPLHMASNRGHLGVVEEILLFDEQATRDSVIIHDEDEDGNTALHLAASHGHSRVCKMLIDKGAELDNSNRNLWPPLFNAVLSGSVETVRTILKPAELAWQDRNKDTCLHLAAKMGHVGVANLLLKNRVSLNGLNGNGQSALDLAISFGHKDVVALFLESDQWKESLRNRTISLGSYKDSQTTPFRKLIQKMPEEAEKVLDKCVSYPPGVEINDRELELVFDFEFMDDTYTSSHWGDPYLLKQHNGSNQTYDKDGNLLASAIPYTMSNLERKTNHPLMHMVKYERADLLYHPVCLALIRQKWHLANVVFVMFILFYGSFTALFSIFMISSKPPYLLNSTMFRPENVNACRAFLREGASTRWYVVTPEQGHAIVYILFLMAILGISGEVFQLYNARRKYLQEPTNFLDWFTYVSASAVVVPVTNCGVRTHWQWQLGTACFFIMWINSIMFLRRMPTVGLYIVMVGEVFITFLKFFVFCFSLFLMAYGFTFFLLLQNDPQFSTPGYSFVKTTVMMIGELDYGDMFHGEDGDESPETHLVTYEAMSYALFLTFLCMVTIVIMNLLTGLAVGDVQSVQKQALLKKLALQVDLALDVECSIPEKLRRRLKCVVQSYTIRPNKLASNLLNRLGVALAGPMSAKAIASAVHVEYEEDLEEQRMRKRAEESGETRHGPHDYSVELLDKVNDHEDQMNQLRDQMDRMEGLVAKCLLILQGQQQSQEADQQPSTPPPSYPPPPPPQQPPGGLAVQPPPAGHFFSMPNLPYIDDPIDPRDPIV